MKKPKKRIARFVSAAHNEEFVAALNEIVTLSIKREFLNRVTSILKLIFCLWDGLKDVEFDVLGCRISDIVTKDDLYEYLEMVDAVVEDEKFMEIALRELRRAERGSANN